MVRISVDVVNNSYQFINPVKQRELSLRNLQIPTIENLGVTKDQFDLIDLSDNNIRRLDNLPLLKRLEALLLHNNRIQQIGKEIGEHLPNLKTLALTNNNITEFGDIDPLSKCGKLEYLTLIGNPLTHKQHYRQYVIYKLKSIRVLDFRRVKQEERKAAKKLFKGSSGEALRRDIVKESAPLRDDENQTTAAVEAVKTRSVEEQNRIKELIKNAKTLAEVEHLQSLLQSGRVLTSGFNTNGYRAAGSGLDEEEMEEDNEPSNGFEPMETTTENNVAEPASAAVTTNGQNGAATPITTATESGDAPPPPVVQTQPQPMSGGMEMEDEDDD